MKGMQNECEFRNLLLHWILRHDFGRQEDPITQVKKRKMKSQQKEPVEPQEALQHSASAERIITMP